MRSYRRRWNRMHSESWEYPVDDNRERRDPATNNDTVRGVSVSAVRSLLKEAGVLAGAGFTQDLATSPRPPWNRANIPRGPSLVPLRRFAWLRGDQAAGES